MLHLVMHKNYRTFHLEVGDSHWLVEGLECEFKGGVLQIKIKYQWLDWFDSFITAITQTLKLQIPTKHQAKCRPPVALKVVL